jgi:hypothetical protein
LSELTIDQFNLKLTAFANKIIDENLPLEKAVIDIAPKIADRIFNHGKKSDHSQIGQYDTTMEMYINPDAAPRAGAVKAKGIQGLKPTTGKTGRHIFESTGEPHKTTYVKNYKDLRNRIGRRIDTVNLNFSNDLESDFKSRNPVKVSNNEYVMQLKRPLNTKKVEGNEKRFGRTFAVSKSEKKHFIETLNFEIANLLK